MIKLRYMKMTILIFLAMSILLAGCQFKPQQPDTLKELNISVVATQMKEMTPPAPAGPPPAAPPAATPVTPPAKTGVPPAVPPGATQAKTGAPPAGPPPTPPAATPPAKTAAAPPSKPAGPPPGPPPTISLTITFKIDNPNDVEVKLQQLNYSVSGSGLSIPVKMGQLFTVESKIPAKGSILREDTIDIVRAGPYAAMWDLIKQVEKWSVNGVALVVQEGFAHPFSTSK